MFSSAKPQAHVRRPPVPAAPCGPVRRTGLVRHLLQRLPGELLAALDVGAGHPAGRPRRSGAGTVTVYKSNARGSVQRVDSEHVEGDGHLDLRALAQALRRRRLVLVRPRRQLRTDWCWTTPQWESRARDRAPKGQVTLEITTHEQARLLPQQRPHPGGEPGRPRERQGNPDRGPGHAEGRGPGGLRRGPGRPLAASSGSSTRRTSAAPAALPAACSRPSKTAATTSCCSTTTSSSNPKASSGSCTFADHCRKPTIVGGHMFDLYNRSVLHTFGEVVDPYRIVPALPHADMETAARLQRREPAPDPVAAPPRGRGLQRLVDVPDPDRGDPGNRAVAAAVHQVGRRRVRPARHGEAGFPTVSLPGAAVWHVSWIDKDDLVGWQAYFHARNRLDRPPCSTAPTTRRPRAARIVQYADIKHLVSMQYFTAHGRG